MGQSRSAQLCHLVPQVREAPGARRGTGHFAHAGKALYLNWRGVKGQESRREREELDKGQPATVTLQKTNKQKRTKGHVMAKRQKKWVKEKKPREIQKCRHCYNRNMWCVTWGNRVLPRARSEARLSALRMHRGQGSHARAAVTQQQRCPVCFGLNV